MRREWLINKLVQVLCLYSFAFIVFPRIVFAQSNMTTSPAIKLNYSPFVQPITDVNVSSATIETYYVGKSSCHVYLSPNDRAVTVLPLDSNSTNIHIGFEPVISTWTYALAFSTMSTFPLVPGQTWYPVYRGHFWMLNESLSVSSGVVKIIKEFSLSK